MLSVNRDCKAAKRFLIKVLKEMKIATKLKPPLFKYDQLNRQYKKLERKIINVGEIIVEKKIVPGDRNYHKFLILCRSRTGSNLLVSLLQSHPQIRAFGEVFTSDNCIHWGYPGYLSNEILQLREQKPIQFLNDVVYREVLSLVSVVGFKLFYNHAQDKHQKVVWKYLQQMPDLKVIHLKRQNILKAHVSHKIAERNDQWILLDNQQEREFEPLKLDYAECLEAFEKTRAYEHDCEQFFAQSNHPILTLNYEKLHRKPEKTHRKLLHFLGVKQRSLTSYTNKQNSLPLKNKVANYEDLKRKFSNTVWSIFFS